MELTKSPYWEVRLEGGPTTRTDRGEDLLPNSVYDSVSLLNCKLLWCKMDVLAS